MSELKYYLGFPYLRFSDGSTRAIYSGDTYDSEDELFDYYNSIVDYFPG